jgi:hypothetical protein
MPELLERLGQLAHERGDSIQRASRDLAGAPEGFLIVTREMCNFVRLLADFWDAVGLELRRGGLPGKELLRWCDMLLNVGELPARYLALVVKVWGERDLPTEMAKPIYADVLSARERLEALMNHVRKAREHASAPPRIAADPEALKRRIREADEKGEWVRPGTPGSPMRQGSPPKKE